MIYDTRRHRCHRARMGQSSSGHPCCLSTVFTTVISTYHKKNRAKETFQGPYRAYDALRRLPYDALPNATVVHEGRLCTVRVRWPPPSGYRLFFSIHPIQKTSCRHTVFPGWKSGNKKDTDPFLLGSCASQKDPFLLGSCAVRSERVRKMATNGLVNC